MNLRCATTARLQSAITLVEVVVALSVVAVTAGGVLSMVGFSFSTAERLRQNQRATQVLLEKLETIRLYTWSQINSNNFVPPTFTDVYDPQAATGKQGLTYSGTLTITNFPASASYSTNLRQLIITLNWTNGNGMPHSRNVSTVIARDGAQNYIY